MLSILQVELLNAEHVKQDRPDRPNCECLAPYDEATGTCTECHTMSEVLPTEDFKIYKPYRQRKNCLSVLNRMQGSIEVGTMRRLNWEYADTLRAKCAGDLTIENVHSNIEKPNDKRHLYFLYGELTGRAFLFDDIQKHLIIRLYDKCCRQIPQRFSVLNIVDVLAKLYNWDNVTPFLCRKFKPSEKLANQIIKINNDKLL